MCVLVFLPVGQSVELCANETSTLAVKPCLSVVYATDENFCIEPITQEGTVVAVLHCLLDRQERATLRGYDSKDYRSHSTQNGSMTMFYLTATKHGLQRGRERDRITLTCEFYSARSNQVVLNISYCSEANQSASPHLLGVPLAPTVRVTVGHSTDIALFNVIAKVSITEYTCMREVILAGNN